MTAEPLGDPLDPVAWLDAQPPEPVQPAPRYELIELCWRHALSIHPDHHTWLDRIDRLAGAAWRNAYPEPIQA